MSQAVATQQKELAGKYHPYPKYKDSGVEWLGDIPNEWLTIPVGRLFSRIKRTGHSEKELLSVYRDYGVIPKSSRDDNNNKESDDLAPYQLVRPNDLVMNKMKAWQGSIAVSEYEGIVSPAYFVYEPSNKLFELAHPRYVHYLLRNPIYITQYMSRSKGIRVNQWDLDPDEFKLIELLLPSKQEQSKIFEFLDYETARIDRLIAQQQRLIELLKEKRQAVISHAVTKGLNPDAPMKDSGVEWLGQVPEHWQIQKTAWHFTAQKGRNGQMLTKEYCGENSGDYPVYSGQTENNGIMGRIDSFEFDFGNDGCLFSTTVGAKAMSLSLLKGKFSLSQNCMVIIPRENNAFSVSFAFYHFQPLFSYERGLIPEHMQASFRMDDLYQYSIAMPPVSEQIEISDFINGEVIKIDYLVQIAEKAITLMQERRSALISAAVTGKIDLRGWTQPAEEVAA
ncbi:restriction endonuclease subunit S [Aeromonas caviae]|uniref:restriction endonuclease subunit S n=1 Tax=Aeromonas caviae TaxID=648 RepID=UPI001373634C|nr:restriction endonuclease subunit S [Aeromonas caviae]NAZ62359.1 restriction endonuclease subunit S [Aeromonas caviae]